MLGWLGHVLWKDDDDWEKINMLYDVDGVKCRGRPRIR